MRTDQFENNMADFSVVDAPRVTIDALDAKIMS
jgi:hypothetical protein